MQLPRIELRTNFDDEDFNNVWRDLCRFIHHECFHKDGRFFDLEGSLVTSDEDKFLREWNNSMPQNLNCAFEITIVKNYVNIDNIFH